MSSQFHERAVVLLNEVEIAQTETATGAWVTMPRAQAFNIWWYLASTTAPSITIYFDYSIFGLESLTQAPPGTYAYGIFHPAYASRTNYRTITLGSALTAQDAWQHIDTPAEMKYPFASCRVRVTEGNAGVVDSLTVAIGIQGL